MFCQAAGVAAPDGSGSSTSTASMKHTGPRRRLASIDRRTTVQESIADSTTPSFRPTACRRDSSV